MKKTLSPVNKIKGQELLYRKQMNRLARGMQKAVRNQVLTYLKEHEGEYVLDGPAADLGMIFRRLNMQFNGTMTMGFAQVTSEDMIRRLEASNKKRFDDNFMRATGVDLGSIVAVEGLNDFMTMNIQQNVLLIKSLPEEYFKQIEIIVNKGFSSGARYSTIFKEISALHGSANSKLMNRIKTIARDQISTINAQMTMKRSLSLGITKGIYRTSKDERVRECHKELDGVEFVLTKGAWSKTCQKFIQPGITDINCRCSYSPVIDL
jgi:SPP1 gp7 family putative phage head morphogenesis protein